MIIHYLFFIFISLVSVMSLVVYPLVTRRIARGRVLETVTATPDVTIIVPVLNEEGRIEKKIEELLSIDYPEESRRIIVVDNGSTDATVEIASRCNVEVVSSGAGKVTAINRGLEATETEIVILTDADVRVEPGAVRSMVRYLHGNVGAVGGFPLLARSDRFYAGSKALYTRRDWEMRRLEGLADTVCSLDGKLIAFRKPLVERFADTVVCDDYWLTLYLRARGFRCIIDREAIVHEPQPSGLLEEIRQIRRRSVFGAFFIGGRFLHMFFNPKYGIFGLWTFPFRRVFPFMAPVFLAYICLFLIFTMPKALLFLVPLSAAAAVLSGRTYSIIQVAACTLSWFDVLTGRFRSQKTWGRIKSLDLPGTANGERGDGRGTS